MFWCTWFHSVRFLGQRRARINKRTSLCRVRSNTETAWCASLKKTKLTILLPISLKLIKNYAGDDANMFLVIHDLIISQMEKVVCLETRVFLATFFSSFAHPPVVSNLSDTEEQIKTVQLQWMGTEDINLTKGYILSKRIEVK